MMIIDTSGQQCPAPLIATKRALKAASTGDSFNVITDSESAFNNIIRFLKDNRVESSSSETGGTWTITVTKTRSEQPSKNPEDYCTKPIPHLELGDFVIAFTSETMGDGDDELGHTLMYNFIKAVKDLDRLPAKMVFYNKGVILVAEDSTVADHLRELEGMGVRLLICETCIRHYKLEDRIRIGTISNMYEISQAMASAGNVIKP